MRKLLTISTFTVIGTGLIGWVLNIVLVLCSGPLCVAPNLHYHRSISLTMWRLVI